MRRLKPYIPVVALRKHLLMMTVLMATAVIPTQLHAQQPIMLTIQKDRFCINGRPEFLILASYFDAGDAECLSDDLDFLQAHGINGIRIFPNWWDQGDSYSEHTLFDAAGHIRKARWRKLIEVLKAARVHKMVVDITFSHETVEGLNIENYKKGILRTVKKLKKYTYLFYDLQNERNGRRTYFSEKDIFSLSRQLRLIQPTIILSASEAYEATPQDDLDFVARTGLDIVNYHEPRGGSWWDRTYKNVEELRSRLQPVYLGEPGRWKPGSSLTAANLITAVTAAKKAGAAAWTFHNEASFHLDHASLQSTLNPTVEKPFLDSLPIVLRRTPWGDTR